MSTTYEAIDTLASTQRARCLGCGEAVGTGELSGTPVWTPHGTCRPYYGAGNRVDYGLWLSMVENDDGGDRPYFDTWSSAEPMRGVPSWFPATSDFLASHVVVIPVTMPPRKAAR